MEKSVENDIIPAFATMTPWIVSAQRQLLLKSILGTHQKYLHAQRVRQGNRITSVTL